jgi:hypothetical protein
VKYGITDFQAVLAPTENEEAEKESTDK